MVMKQGNPEPRELQQVLNECRRLQQQGKLPERAELLQRYPRFASEISAWLDRPTTSGISASLAETQAGPPADVSLETPLQFSGRVPEQLPRRFGRYQLLQHLGAGGMGRVYLAQDTLLDRRVALKLPQPMQNDVGEFMERFAREARAAAALKHPHICSVFDAGREQGLPYITMEFVDGPTLSQVLQQRGALPPEQALEIAVHVAEAVQHAHAAGVIHRDLKPGNILMASERHPMVTDFGLARRVDGHSEERITGEGLLLGTPAWMAPEQMRGDQQLVGTAADLYSLGVILFEMLAGRRPFMTSGAELLANVLRDRPPLIRSLRPELSEDLEDLVQKLLQTEPDRRPKSMADVVQWLRKLQAARADRTLTGQSGLSRELQVSKDAFQLRQRQTEDLLKRGQYAAAIHELELLANEVAPAAREAGEWARKKLPAVRAEAKALSPAGIAAMLQTAQQLFSKCDYAGCQQLLDDVPPARRTDELEQLLRRARACEAEADQLWLDIREMEQKRKTDGLEMLVKRLLKLKPGHAAAKRLHKALQSYSSVPVHRRNYKYEQGRLQPLPEPSLLAQWGLLAGLTFALAFLAVYSYVIVYLKSGSQVLQVAIDDQWLKSLGGRLTLQVDGQEHLIEVGNGEVRGLQVAVKFGDHDFSVRHNGVLVHQPKTFEISRDGRRVLQITPTDIRLLNQPDPFIPWQQARTGQAAAEPQAGGAPTGAAPVDSAPPAVEKPGGSVATSATTATVETVPENLVTQGPGWSVLQGATLEGLLAWSKTLPPEIYPHRVTLQVGSGERIFDALAEPWPKNADGLQHPSEWQIEVIDADADWGRAIEGQRPLVLLPFRDGNAVKRLCIGTKHNVFFSWWFGSAGFMNEKMQEGIQQDYRDIPGFLSSLGWYKNGEWLMVRTPSDRNAVQSHTDLTAQGLQTLLQHAQEHQLRPLILDHQHSGREADLFTVLVNSGTGTWASSLHLSAAQFARMLPLVSSQAGRPACIASTVLPAGTVYRVVWWGIAQELITKLEEQARPAGPLPDTAVSVFRLPARNQAKTAEGAAVPAVAPFDADAARQYQNAWAEHLQVPTEYTNSIGMKFRLIPPGRFLMGSTAEQVAAAKPFLYTELDPARKDRADSEMPQHQVTLTRPFYLGTTEVTQESFRRVTGVNPASLTEGPGDRLQAPVETVTWINCVEFCNQLSQGEGLEWAYRFTPDLVTQTGVGGYRLPTEAEWEFACRAGTTSQFHTGDDPAGLAAAAWIEAENGHQTKPVAQKQPNAFGLFDMHGNVFEWVHDGWRQDWYSNTTGAAAIDPRCDVGIEGRRIVRGGEKSFSWAEARSGSRDGYAADSTWWDTGFRVALSVEAVRALRAVGR